MTEAVVRLFDDDELGSLDPLMSQDCEIARGRGRRFVCGVDEVGRGALAGPIYAAAVVLTPAATRIEIKDSKRFSSRSKRGRVADEIRQACMAWSIAHLDAEDIDLLGIQECNRRVMASAISRLGLDAMEVVAVLDGNPLWSGPVDGVECVWIPDADATSLAVAAASIIAKTERDSIMERLAEVYPDYGFDRHVGYGAPEHITAIKRHGMIPGLHRSTFIHLDPSEDDG